MNFLKILSNITAEPIDSEKLKEKLPQTPADAQAVQTILNSVYAIMGLVAVGFIIYGGFTWIMSQGEPAKLSKARNAIIYAVIGLIIVMLAAAITNFIITSAAGSSTGGLIVGGF